MQLLLRGGVSLPSGCSNFASLVATAMQLLLRGAVSLPGRRSNFAPLVRGNFASLVECDSGRVSHSNFASLVATAMQLLLRGAVSLPGRCSNFASLVAAPFAAGRFSGAAERFFTAAGSFPLRRSDSCQRRNEETVRRNPSGGRRNGSRVRRGRDFAPLVRGNSGRVPHSNFASLVANDFDPGGGGGARWGQDMTKVWPNPIALRQDSGLLERVDHGNPSRKVREL